MIHCNSDSVFFSPIWIWLDKNWIKIWMNSNLKDWLPFMKFVKTNYYSYSYSPSQQQQPKTIQTHLKSSFYILIKYKLNFYDWTFDLLWFFTFWIIIWKRKWRSSIYQCWEIVNNALSNDYKNEITKSSNKELLMIKR